MSNIRTIFDNAIERAALSSSPAGTGVMSAANLAGGRKSRSWRAATLLATVNALWPAGAEALQAVVWPICNFSPTSEQRVRVSTEDAAINRLRYSEQLDNAAWVKSAATVTGAGTQVNVTGIPAPNDAITVDKITEDATTGVFHHIYQDVTGYTLNDTISFAIYLKAAERGFASIKFDATTTAAPATSSVIINLTTGAKSAETAGGWTYTVSQSLNGFWRVTCTRTATANGLIRPMVGPATSSTVSVYNGVAGNGIYAWGAMATIGPMSSYYPTTTAAATRPAGYIDSWQSYQYDSGFVPANNNAPARRPRGFTAAQAAGAYFNGGGTAAWHWLPTEMQARGLSVTIRDNDNLQGYIEAPFLVAGAYWEASYNPTKVPLGFMDRTTIGYARGGDQWADASDIRRTLDIELSQLAIADRARMVEMLTNSRAYPILVAVFPDDPDAALVRDNMLYGRRSRDSDISPDTAFTLSMSIPLEEV